MNVAYLGIYFDASTDPLVGTLGYVAVYRRLLTPGELHANYRYLAALMTARGATLR
jgi:hypothetical protein